MQKFRSGLAESLLHRNTAPLERARLHHQPMILEAVIEESHTSTSYRTGRNAPRK